MEIAKIETKQCDVCGETFEFLSDLNNHIQQLHYQEVSYQPLDLTLLENPKCDICFKTFLNSSSLLYSVKSKTL